jgi:hypothetical protein
MNETIKEIFGYVYLATLWGMVALTMVFAGATYGSIGEDRRDVNRDGVVDIVDLSVLAVEIQEEDGVK